MFSNCLLSVDYRTVAFATRSFVIHSVLMVVLLTIASFLLSLPAFAGNLRNGESLFQENCAICHIGGANLIIPEKNLKHETLMQFGLASKAAIVHQITQGKNIMPAFGEALSEEQIENIAAYVLTQSEKGW